MAKYWGGYTGPASNPYVGGPNNTPGGAGPVYTPTPVAPPAPAPRYQPSLAPSGGGYGGAPVSAPAYSTGAPATAAGSTNVADTPYAWMLGIPDVANVLNQWQSGGFTDTWLKAHIMATPWYKDTAEATRNWLQLIAQDPKTATLQAQASTEEVYAMAREMGVELDQASAMDIGDHIHRFGWNEAQVRNEIMNRWQYHRGMPGQAGQVEAQLTALARDYLVPLSDVTMGGWSGAIVRGAATVDGYRDEVEAMAKSMFPSISKQIDAGLTTRQIVDPYAQIAAKELGVNPAAVDFFDPKWQKALDYTDPKTGQKQMMSFSDWTSELRRNPIYNWDTTQNAREAATELESKLLSQFGMI